MTATPTRSLLLVLLLASTLIATEAAFNVDVNKTIIESNRQWSRVKLGFNGGDSPYKITYDQYP